MEAAGLQKTSLIDYPGKVSCVIFLPGCNFTCPYCHNPELAKGLYPERISLNQLTTFLTQRRNLLDGVVITGGEPTLHTGLPDLCRTIQGLGYAVKLDTNGSRPKVLAQLMRAKLINYIAMDIKTSLEAYRPPLCRETAATKVAQSVDLIMAGDLAYEFRTTCVAPFVDENHMARITATIQGARQYTLQAFHTAAILSPDYFKGLPAGLPPETLTRLQAVAAPFVDRCTIR